jgi:hypothetical protein
MKIYNHILPAADRGEVLALCLLDLIAAFDTVDHEVLLSRLENRFTVIGSRWTGSGHISRADNTQLHYMTQCHFILITPVQFLMGPLWAPC